MKKAISAATSAALLASLLATAVAPATTTNGTITNNSIGSLATGQGQCYAIATLATAPVAFWYLGGPTGASAIGGVTLKDNLDGMFCIQPGVAVSVQSQTAAAILCSISWKEVAITEI